MFNNHIHKQNESTSIDFIDDDKNINCKTSLHCEKCKNCSFCINCVNCVGCVGCVDCVNCKNCMKCVDCRNCSNMMYIKNKKC